MQQNPRAVRTGELAGQSIYFYLIALLARFLIVLYPILIRVPEKPGTEINHQQKAYEVFVTAHWASLPACRQRGCFTEVYTVRLQLFFPHSDGGYN